MRIARFAAAGRIRSAAVLGVVGVLLAATPLLAESPIQVPIEVDQPLPNVGDQIRLRTDVLQTAPYNQDPGRYKVVFFGCVGTAEQCRDGRRWQRLTVRDARGVEAQPRQRYECTSGPCEMVLRLAQPREATIYFRAVVHDMEDQGSDRSPALAVRWVQPTTTPTTAPSTGPSLTLTVNGASCTAHFGTAGNGTNEQGVPYTDRCVVRSPNGARISIAPDGSAPPPTIHAVLNGFPANWTITYTWTGGSGGPCGNPCDPTGLAMPFNGNFGRPPNPFVDRSSVQVDANWDGTGDRGMNPVTGSVFQPITAIVVVDFVVR